MTIYVVKPGDSVYSIARSFGVTPQSIIDNNELTNPSRLALGQTLVVMPAQRNHVVRRGESLYTIARQYRVTVQDLLDANPSIGSNGLIYPGQSLVVPASTVKLGTIEVNGFAFPNISNEVLQKTLPNLTYLSIFSYDLNPNGSLRPINDTRLIQEARRAGVAPLMVISNIEEGGGFSSDLAHTILTNDQIQQTLINNIISTVQSKNYYGINLDFEYIYPNDRENYNNFVRKISAQMRRLGYFVSSSLAPKNAANQQGLLYEAHDYPVHGALLDRVILMTYEWGYTAGPPLPVAPLNEVRKVLNYAVSAIPRRKILMGMPNYGYDWNIPFVRGTRAETIGNVAAVNRAIEVGAEIKYDTTAQSPYYNYWRGSRQHVVWFEDARSIQAKLLLVNQLRLAGVSYWTIGRYFPQNWIILNSMYNVKKVL